MSVKICALLALACFAAVLADTRSGCQLSGCPNAGECCSNYGYCGTTSAYCAADNCYSGNCVGNSPQPICAQPTQTTAAPQPTATQPAPLTGCQISGCPSSMDCCSSHGYCGRTLDYCDAPNCYSGRCVNSSTLTGCQLSSCPSGQCCSSHGYCGTTAAHCDPLTCYSGACQEYAYPQYTTVVPANTNNKVVMGYVASWMTGRTGSCYMSPEFIDATRFTHIAVAFADFSAATGYKIVASNGDDTSGFYKRVNLLKNRNNKLKTLISVGGGAFDVNVWIAMAQNAAFRQAFVASCVKFARANSFDGIDIDWEGHTADIADYIGAIQLFQDLRVAIDNDARVNSNKLLLTAPVQPDIDATTKRWVGPIVPYVDFLGVMAYDFAGSWSTTVQPLTPFNATTLYLDIYRVLNFYVSLGLPPSKTIFGFANYGVSFALKTSANCKIGGLINAGQAMQGTCGGSLPSYADTLAFKAKSGVTYKYDTGTQTALICNGTQAITYDDPTSLAVKINYALGQGYAGGLVWTVDRSTVLTDYVSKSFIGNNV